MQKITVALFVLLFSLVAFPWSGTAENSLSEPNLLAVINQVRVREGLRVLKPNLRLSQAAAAKAEHMLKQNYFAHTSPEGLEAWDFMARANLKYVFAGENLATNYLNPYELTYDFLQSPSHRANLLSPLFSDVGLAVVSPSPLDKGEGPTTIVVQLFALPAEPNNIVYK